MLPLSTPHAHTTWVDGKHSVREMVEAAIDAGFDSIGFSEHNVQPFDECCLTLDREKAYREDVLRAKSEYADRILVRLGIEWDAKGIVDRTQYEYVIGSNHYMKFGGDFFSVDSSAQELDEGIRRFFGGDPLAMAEAYYKDLGEFLLAARPDIVGHFDLLTKFNERDPFLDETASRYRAAAIRALECARACGGLLEINTGAIARGYRTTPYPAAWLLPIWREMGGGVILTSDCHDAKCLSAGYDAALQLIRQAGFETCWALGHEALFEEYPISGGMEEA